MKAVLFLLAGASAFTAKTARVSKPSVASPTVLNAEPSPGYKNPTALEPGTFELTDEQKAAYGLKE